MTVNNTMKAWFRGVTETALVILLVPQVFVGCYFFPLFFKGENRLGLLHSLCLYALTISWVSAPFLTALSLLVRVLLRTSINGYVTFLCCVGAGYFWLELWNLFVYDVFTYGRAAVPVLLCSIGTAGYALAKAFYLKGLPPPEKTKKEGADLPG